MTQVEQPPGWLASRWQRVRGPFGMLSQRNFRLLVTGQFSALIGDQLFLVALPFVLLTGAHDARDLGMVLLCLGLARAVAVPLGGGIGDRFQKRMVMINSDIARCVFSAMMAMVVLSPSQPLWLMMAIATGIGFAQGIFLPSSYSIVPQLVDRKDIVAANSVVTAQMNLSVLIGPAIGGLLVAGISPGPVLLIHAATFAFSATCLALIRVRHSAAGGSAAEPEPAAEPETEAAAEAATEPVADGSTVATAETEDASPDAPSDVSYPAFLRYFIRSRLLLFSVTVTFIVNLGYVGMVQIALPAMARERFDDPAVAFGFLLTGTGVGALIGALLAHSLLARRGGALIALTAGILEGFMILLVPLAAFFIGSWLALFGIGLAGAVTNVFFISALQRRVPKEYLGRTMSMVMLAAFGTSPVSYGVIAFLVSTSGPTAAFMFTGITTILAFAVGFLSREIRGLALV